MLSFKPTFSLSSFTSIKRLLSNSSLSAIRVVLSAYLRLTSTEQMGDQSWVLIGRTDVEAETPILWPPDAKSRLIEKTLMLGKIQGRREKKGMVEDEMV